MDDAHAEKNLLGKTLYPGIGLEARMATHCPCKTRGWHVYAGGGGEGYDVDTKPCVGCSINTCDECRIQIIY
jgi:hypothetical protein